MNRAFTTNAVLVLFRFNWVELVTRMATNMVVVMVRIALIYIGQHDGWNEVSPEPAFVNHRNTFDYQYGINAERPE